MISDREGKLSRSPLRKSIPAARVLLVALASGAALSLIIAWVHATVAAFDGKNGRLRDDADVLVQAISDRARKKHGDIPWPKPDPAKPHYECRSYGFPLGALGTVYRLSSSRPGYPSNTSQIVSGIGLGKQVQVNKYLSYEAALPVLPMTQELVADTLILGIPGGVFVWWRERRRRFRERFNQCEKCGYERAGLARETPCPECGLAPAVQRL